MKRKNSLFKKPRKGQEYQSKAMKKKLKQELAKRPPPTRYQKNIKHIERGHESIQAQKRQIEAERQYRNEANSMVPLVSSDSEDDEDNCKINSFENLSQNFRLHPDSPGYDSAEETGSDEQEMVVSSDDAGDNEEDAGEGDEEVDVEQEVDMSDTDETDMDDGAGNSSDSESESIGHPSQSEEEHDSGASSDDEESAEEMNDPFLLHTNSNLSPAMVEAIAANPKSLEKTTVPFGSLGTLCIELPTCPKESIPRRMLQKERYAKPGELPVVPEEGPVDWAALYVKDRIARNIPEEVDPLQRDTFALLNNYQDLFYARRTHDNGDQLRFSYCLHALNHVLKAVSKVQHHTVKLAASKSTSKPKQNRYARRPQVQSIRVPQSGVEYRDQGYVRPKVLIVVPFRESALQVVNVLVQLFAGDNTKAVANYKRFTDEYGGGSTLSFPQRNRKPLDYERTFAGNIDDNFRLGIAVNRSSMKLYAKYYSSDVIVASPLGLRMAIGAKGEQHRDYDFLANIELLVIDQADVCYAQNWEHVLHVMEHLHQQPSSTEHTEFSRVREWCLNGWSKFYRQTVVLSTLDLPEIRALYSRQFDNYRGKARTLGFVAEGTIRNVAVQVPQNFQRIDTTQLESEGNARFAHFINVILPQARSVAMGRCLIYVPSYFDFVRLRNHFKLEEISFTQICEYTTDAKIARARDMFHHGSKHFLLYSERAHFFRRHRIKGIRHLIMYGPPVFPQFYPEMVNLMAKENQNRMDGVAAESMTVTVLYTRFNMQQLSEILGTKCAQTIMKAPRSVYRFSTDLK
ncbi:U3 small nucleolar RNA-associated protein 25 homolog [Anopheles nili]|uniref:U3 small nucleolar RNA-associated protein 25 homolog n=1 Tax=Anopheles nili TaxID=185578 RepID=UPI00237ACCF5|nr:U3 small nucleolar RNA-associated protein 25 homolog [Anopheles nili]